MFSKTIRYITCALIGVGASFLGLGVLLTRAAAVTGADSNYNASVSWFSVLSSGIWPPSWQQCPFGVF